MEWVLAVLGVGCVFFAFQITMDYVRYRRVIKPRIARLEEAKAQLSTKIEAAKAGLGDSQDQLDPIKEDVGRLEQDYQELQEQIQQERSKHRSRPIRFKS